LTASIDRALQSPDNVWMAASQRAYEYSVERDHSRQGFVDVALVRREARHGVLDRLIHHPGDHATVLFHRPFRRMLDLAALETYAGQLAAVADHANTGTFGCFVETKSAGGMVEIALYERWFDGQHVHCEELALRRFDPSDESTLVASAEFLAELEAFAERRNEEREGAYLDAGIDESERVRRTIEQQSAADELARILRREL
jgi:hypothetical protein